MKFDIPEKQSAVQLVGPDELKLNTAKPVYMPGPFQILCKVEATGLCFSDLKLLKQFSKHARKTIIIEGIDPAILDEIPSYKPDDEPTVPGHETVVRVCAIGDKVERVNVGARYLVQTDYRWLPTTNSNGSFGYNFEGGLQEYVLMDQRVITSPKGESFLLPASEELSASAVGLVEPWACVEDAYASKERMTLKEGGQMLVVAETEIDSKIFKAFIARFGKPAKITVIGTGLGKIDVEVVSANSVESFEDAAFDDVIYFGTDAKTAEILSPKVSSNGIYNIVQCGGKFGCDVVTQVGRTHYGGIRIIGTTGSDPAESMNTIPQTGEIREGDKIDVIGAGGPMGVMHVIRNICQGVKGVTVYAGDLDIERLEGLGKIAKPLAEKNGVGYKSYSPAEGIDIAFDYVALMAPVPKLVENSVKTAAKGCIINIFAGIPADVNANLDLDAYIEKKLYFIGTSGSVLQDMLNVLAKAESFTLDTNISVAAVTGMEGAVEGIRAVENRLIPGKIIVYPQCKGLGLTSLDQLGEKYPQVTEKLDNGLWTKAAEEALLAEFK